MSSERDDAYFELLEQPLPANRDGVLDALSADRLICACDAGDWSINNLRARTGGREHGT